MNPPWACKELRYRANIARYGGDEFVILARSADEKTIENLRSKINHYLDKLNREAAAPYELSVSVGIAKAKRNKTLKILISEADEKLYAEKARRR